MSKWRIFSCNQTHTHTCVGPDTNGGLDVVKYSAYEALQQQCEKLVQQLESIKEVAARLYRDAVIEERVDEALAEYQAFKESEK